MIDVQKSLKSVQKRLNLKKKARSKFMSSNLALNLVNVKNSPLIKSYWNTYHCCGVLEQKGKKVVGKYCGNRWCLTCNRVRTAKMINGYSGALQQIARPYFVTLTIPNQKEGDLRPSILNMISTLREIKKKYQKINVHFTGIRKLECTYNDQRNDFHPHFHFLISGRVNAQLLISEWLKAYPKADRKAQDYRRADDNSIKELFKYFTKLVVKTKKENSIYKKVQVNSLDIIFQSIQHLRVYQPMGIVKNMKAYTRFVTQIKQTYKERKSPVIFVIQEHKDLFTEHISAIFTATLQHDPVEWLEYNTTLKLIQETEIRTESKAPKIKLQKLNREDYVRDFYKKQSLKRLKEIKDETLHEPIKKVCYEIRFTGINLPEPFKSGGIKTFKKLECAKYFEEFYTKLAGINLTEDMEDLFSREIEDLPEDVVNWSWDKHDWKRGVYNWVDKTTGEIYREEKTGSNFERIETEDKEMLSEYFPSEKMQEFVDNIFVQANELDRITVANQNLPYEKKIIGYNESFVVVTTTKKRKRDKITGVVIEEQLEEVFIEELTPIIFSNANIEIPF